MNSLKLTEEIATDIRARVKSLDFGAIEKLRKAKEENGTFDVIISTEDLDRSGEIVKQSGWELANYKNNPIVLWGHDYYSLPIGICTETYATEYHGVPATGAKGVFLSADINPFAQQVRKLYEFGNKAGKGVGCTTSVGFIPKEFDNDNGRVITKAELLEFSFVPIPANQGVGPAEGRMLTFDEARTLGLDMVGMRSKGMTFVETAGLIPADTKDNKAPEDTKWVKPTLKDFTEKAWAELNETEKVHIAEHFAYSAASDLKKFEDLKLPYRRASDSAIVLSGLKAAMRDLLGSRSGIDVEGDVKPVYEHLAKLYKLFGKEAPEFKTLKEAQAGDTCTMDDGSDGVLTTGTDGALVCMPIDQDKSAGNASQKALLKAVADEHERHVGEVEKCVEAFQESMTGEKAAEATTSHLKDLRSSMQDEHTMHRAKSVSTFRGFEPAEDKAFDKNLYLKSLREQHDAYDAKTVKALDDFETKCTKDLTEEDTEALTTAFDANQRAHKKSVTKLTKAMCKEAYGQDEPADEKTIEILKEFLAPHIDAQLLPAVAATIGAKLATERKTKLSEAHQHLKAATAVLEALHKDFADGSEEEGRSDSAGNGAGDGSREPRSRTRAPSHTDAALQAHMQGREILRGIEAAAREGLGKFNAEIRDHSKK